MLSTSKPGIGVGSEKGGIQENVVSTLYQRFCAGYNRYEKVTKNVRVLLLPSNSSVRTLVSVIPNTEAVRRQYMRMRIKIGDEGGLLPKGNYRNISWQWRWGACLAN